MAIAYLTTAGVLAMWLCWDGLRWATNKGEKQPVPTGPLLTLGGMAIVAVVLWLSFGLADKLTFDRPLLLLLGLIAIPIFALGVVSLQQLGPARRWTSVALRIFVLLLITTMLAGLPRP